MLEGKQRKGGLPQGNVRRPSCYEMMVSWAEGQKAPWILRRHPLKFPRNAQILLQYGHGPGSSLIPG